MDNERDISTAERVARLLHHLGIARAHFVRGVGEAADIPEAVASLALVMPSASEAGSLLSLAARGALAIPPLVVHGDGGPLARAAPSVLAAYPGARAVVLRGYASALWSDLAADRTGEVGAALLAHLADADGPAALADPRLPEGSGEVGGLTYRVRGDGPPLLLFPLELAPSQWEPLVPALAARYCTITLGGPHLGMVAHLEHRARAGYGVVVDRLIDALALPAGGVALEVGCGAGTVARRLARRVAHARVIGVDISPYLLGEAVTMAGHEGLAGRIAFREGRAEALPFPDASVDAALACTVLEEVDADRALSELVRVVRPGGRVGVVVRAADLPFWDSLPLPPAIRAKLNTRPNAGSTATGCADASLYCRFCALGLANVALGPQFAAQRPGPGMRAWRAPMEAGMLAALDAPEADTVRAAIAQAETKGSYLLGQVFHCAVGTKP